MLVVITSVAAESGDRRDGQFGFTIKEILAHLDVSVNYTGMNFSDPRAFLAALRAGADTLRQYQETLAARLREAPRKA